MRPLNFAYEASESNGTPWNYGRLYWCVTLIDGRECFVYANTITIENGVLNLIGHYHKPQLEGERRWSDWNTPCNECDSDHPMMVLAPGSWADCYAASIMHGNPVIADHVQGNMQTFDAKPGRTQNILNCYLCGESLTDNIEMDHVLPKSRGGNDSLLMPVHKECNRTKGNRPLMKRPIV